MAKKKEQVRNIVIISDTHIGCKVGLCHPDGAELDDGGIYMPSALQNKIWSYWEEFWGEWVPRVTRNEPYIVVHNGDVVDGVHHNSTTQWSHNLGDQANHAIKILEPVVDLCEGRYYQIRGTEAHVGKSGVEEERIARVLGAIPNEEGQYARYELWINLGGELCHFLHHIGNTSSAHGETSSLNAEYANMCVNAARFHHKPPKFVVRSHRHRNCEVRLTEKSGYATVFVTPCWQAKTPFAWKIAGARLSVPQFGGSLIRLGDEEIHTRHFIRDIERSGVVEV